MALDQASWDWLGWPQMPSSEEIASSTREGPCSDDLPLKRLIFHSSFKPCRGSLLTWRYQSCFLFFVFYSVFAFMNVIIAVVVESTIEAARSDREILVRSEIKAKEAFLSNMREIFETVDLDSSGEISMAEMKEKMQDGEVAHYFTALGVDAKQVTQLFRLLDNDDSGTITREEFLKGCLHLRGDAKSIDVAVIRQEIKLIRDILEETLECVEVDRVKSTRSGASRRVSPPRSKSKALESQCASNVEGVPDQQSRRHWELSLLRLGSSCDLGLPDTPGTCNVGGLAVCDSADCGSTLCQTYSQGMEEAYELDECAEFMEVEEV